MLPGGVQAESLRTVILRSPRGMRPHTAALRVDLMFFPLFLIVHTAVCQGAAAACHGADGAGHEDTHAAIRHAHFVCRGLDALQIRSHAAPGRCPKAQTAQLNSISQQQWTYKRWQVAFI
eukprot:1157908-Pelagomonas_calceolata.AAC.11